MLFSCSQRKYKKNKIIFIFIFIDLTKTFDIFNDILLHKFEYYKLDERLLIKKKQSFNGIHYLKLKNIATDLTTLILRVSHSFIHLLIDWTFSLSFLTKLNSTLLVIYT